MPVRASPEFSMMSVDEPRTSKTHPSELLSAAPTRCISKPFRSMVTLRPPSITIHCSKVTGLSSFILSSLATSAGRSVPASSGAASVSVSSSASPSVPSSVSAAVSASASTPAFSSVRSSEPLSACFSLSCLSNHTLRESSFLTMSVTRRSCISYSAGKKTGSSGSVVISETCSPSR